MEGKAASLTVFKKQFLVWRKVFTVAAEKRNRVPMQSRLWGCVQLPQPCLRQRGLPDLAPGGWALDGSQSAPFGTMRCF